MVVLVSPFDTSPLIEIYLKIKCIRKSYTIKILSLFCPINGGIFETKMTFFNFLQLYSLLFIILTTLLTIIIIYVSLPFGYCFKLTLCSLTMEYHVCTAPCLKNLISYILYK